LSKFYFKHTKILYIISNNDPFFPSRVQNYLNITYIGKNQKAGLDCAPTAFLRPDVVNLAGTSSTNEKKY